MAIRSRPGGWALAAGLAAAGFFLSRRGHDRRTIVARQRSGGGRNAEDRLRSGTSDDILGISHGGGRDQYGGSFGSGQSGGGAYANPHSGQPPGQGGTRAGSYHADPDSTGGSSNQAYYGGGQLGDRNYSDHSHSAASVEGGPEHGHARYTDHPSQHGARTEDEVAQQVNRQGFGTHQGFGNTHQGQTEQGQEHGGPHVGPAAPKPDRARR